MRPAAARSDATGAGFVYLIKPRVWGVERFLRSSLHGAAVTSSAVTPLRTLLATAVLTAAVGSGCGGGDIEPTKASKPQPPGVSSLDYSPKPFWQDMSRMRVRFTTTGPAGPRRQYVVWLFAGQSHPHQQCNPESATWDILGGVGKTVEVVLDAEEFYENARFCSGERSSSCGPRAPSMSRRRERNCERSSSRFIVDDLARRTGDDARCNEERTGSPGTLWTRATSRTSSRRPQAAQTRGALPLPPRQFPMPTATSTPAPAMATARCACRTIRPSRVRRTGLAAQVAGHAARAGRAEGLSRGV